MTEPSEQLEALSKQIAKRISETEQWALRMRRTSLVLRLLQLLCLIAVPILIFSVPDRSPALTAAGILAFVATIATTTLQAFRFDVRWEHYISVLHTLQRLRFELEVRGEQTSLEYFHRELTEAAEAAAQLHSSLPYPAP